MPPPPLGSARARARARHISAAAVEHHRAAKANWNQVSSLLLSHDMNWIDNSKKDVTILSKRQKLRPLSGPCNWKLARIQIKIRMQVKTCTG